MSFREKSAWVMALVLGGAGLWYLSLVTGAWRELGTTPPAWVVVPFIILLVLASIVSQVVLAVSDPKNAERPADERERPIIDRAGNWSGIVLGFGAVSSLLLFMQHGDGNLLFHSVMGSLLVAAIAEEVFQIVLMRRA